MFITVKPVLEAKIEKRDVPKVYQKIAPKYDLWGALTESKARNRCLELAAIQDGEAVLEVAVGTGLAFVEILKSNPHGTNEGIDLTEEMLAQAREKAEQTGLKNYHLQVDDAYHLDHPDNTFDVLINNYMFDLLPEEDFSIVLGEFKRVLRPGGRLVMVNMAQCERWHNTIWEYVYRMNPALMGGCRGVSLQSHLKSLGFIDVRREFISQMTFPSEVVYSVKAQTQ